MRLVEEFGQRRYEEGKQDGEQNIEEREKRGFERGWDEKGLKVAKNLLKEDLSLERISQVTDVPIGQLELLKME